MGMAAAVVGSGALAVSEAQAVPPPRVQQMVVFPDGRAPVKTLRPRAATIRVRGRRCAVASRTPLAALLRSGVGSLGVRDYGSCSSRPKDGGGLFVYSIAGVKNRGYSGWVYKVGTRLGTAGAADPSGPFGNGRLSAGARVTWFYGRSTSGGSGFQRTLWTRPRAEEGGVVLVRVTAYDDFGRGRPAKGATVHLGERSARTDSQGVARLTDVAAGRYSVYAEQRGRIRSFPDRVTVG